MRRPVCVKGQRGGQSAPLAVIHPASIRTLGEPRLARCMLGSDG